MDNEYYILDSGERIGPLTKRQLMDRPLEPGDVILLPSQTQGVPAYSMPEFTTYFKSEGIYYPTQQNTSSYLLRLPAYIIDAVIITMGTMVLSSMLIPRYIEHLQSIFTPDLLRDPQIVEKLSNYRVELVTVQLAVFIITILYNATCESSRLRASVGKYILGLAVVDGLGYSLTFWHALKRNLGKSIYEIAGFFIGFFAYIAYLRMIWGERHQAVHDMIAGCYIVKKDK